MSLEAIKQITDIEQSYQQQKKDALAAAQKLVIDAERAGKANLEKAKTQAESQTRLQLKEAEEKAVIHAEKLMKEAELRCESIRNTAMQRLERAVAAIIERIVGSV